MVRRSSASDPPVLLVKWYDVTKWLLDRLDSFPKNQRFVFGQRIADRTLNILELLVEAAYSSRKAHLLARANRDIEVLRWLIRMAKDRKLLTPRPGRSRSTDMVFIALRYRLSPCRGIKTFQALQTADLLRLACRRLGQGGPVARDQRSFLGRAADTYAARNPEHN
ncbi:MAG: four helix bundle protein, partial [Phycisphaerae bacterium]